jgi:hypothetical protein
MAGLINLQLLADFFNKIGPELPFQTLICCDAQRIQRR